MKINESSWDSIRRVFSGYFLLYLGLGAELKGAIALPAEVLGLFLLLTGVIGFCPIYTIFRGKNKLFLKRSLAVDLRAQGRDHGNQHIF